MIRRPVQPKTPLIHIDVRAYELVQKALAQFPNRDATAARKALHRLQGPAERAKRKALRPIPLASDLEWQKERDLTDAAASRYVRFRDTRGGPKLSERVGTCNTCLTPKTGDKLQCCHWISRKEFGTRWHEMNLGAGCWGCNSKLYGAGRPTEFEVWIRSRFGNDIPDKLRYYAKIGKRKPSIAEMRAKREDFEIKLANLLAREAANGL